MIDSKTSMIPSLACEHLIIGISGASGAIYGIRLLEILKQAGITTHLVMSKSAQITIACETDYSVEQVRALAGVYYSSQDMAARISSGSFKTRGMIIAPCSMRSMGEIASCATSSLLTRAADVVLKEQRKLVLMVRETPLHAIHLEQMQRLAQAGAIIAPPVPAFYNRPNSLNDMINHSVGRVLDLFDIPHDLVRRWDGATPSTAS